MPIKGYHLPAIIFLTELSTQVSLSRRAAERLTGRTSGWLENAGPVAFDKAPAPIEIAEWCTLFLSATALIQRLLFLGRRDPRRVPIAARRCAGIQALLGLNEQSLPALRSVDVRNSWEHLDERIDDVFRSFTAGSVSSLSVADPGPPQSTIVLKRFDPARHEILFGGDGVQLSACMAELEELQQRVDDAFPKLRETPTPFWNPKPES